jgi:hypothetical protein
MKTYQTTKTLLVNQELFETDTCTSFWSIPSIKRIVFVVKNSINEKTLLLKLSLLQYFFQKKFFILCTSTKYLSTKKKPLGAVISIRKDYTTFLTFLLSCCKDYDKFILIGNHDFFFKVFFKNTCRLSPYLLKQIFRFKS